VEADPLSTRQTSVATAPLPLKPRKFERWSVERYRSEMGLPPIGAPAALDAAQVLAASPGRAAKGRTRGGALSAKPASSKRFSDTLASGHPSEERIHRDCADWVFEQEALFPTLRWLMHVPNGGKRSRGEAGKMRAMGVRKGASDWIHPFPSPHGRFNGLAIEVKSHAGTVSDEQQEFLNDAEAAGWLTGVARSREQFVELVLRWLLENN